MVTTLAIIASLIVALKDRNANSGSWRLYFSLSRKTHFLAFLWQIKNKKRIFYIGDYYKRVSDIVLLRSFSNVGNSWLSSQKLNDKCNYNVIIIIIITLLLALLHGTKQVNLALRGQAEAARPCGSIGASV